MKTKSTCRCVAKKQLWPKKQRCARRFVSESASKQNNKPFQTLFDTRMLRSKKNQNRAWRQAVPALKQNVTNRRNAARSQPPGVEYCDEVGFEMGRPFLLRRLAQATLRPVRGLPSTLSPAALLLRHRSPPSVPHPSNSRTIGIGPFDSAPTFPLSARWCQLLSSSRQAAQIVLVGQAFNSSPA